MTTLRDDLITLATHAGVGVPGAAVPGAVADLPEELQKINWQRLICFAIPIANIVLPMYGLPPLPVPAFCTAPADVPDGA
jgi:hypothetical protein